jgi:hypothetical protein
MAWGQSGRKRPPVYLPQIRTKTRQFVSPFGKMPNAGPEGSALNCYWIKADQLQPDVPPQVLHFMQVPLRTNV